MPTKEQRAPGDLLREHLEDDGGENGGAAPAPGPGALHGPDSLAAISAANDFADEHRPRRPFAAEAEALEAAHHEQLLEIIGEARQKSEESEPRNHDHEQPRAADAVRKHTGDPATESGNH
jgi:hypothetical protein